MKVSLFGNNTRPEVLEQVRQLIGQLSNVEIVKVEESNMALSVGGDGTFLRTAATVGGMDIPILGINAGHLGFLADVPLDELQDALKEVLEDGKYVVQRRRLLQLEIHDCIQKYQKYALNEISILKRDQSSMVSVSVWIDGTFLNQYDADGLVIATPTGSTAYSMSAGGPILEPLTHCWVIVPIAPHSLTTRPLVIRDSSKIDIEVNSRNNIYLVAVDGQTVHLTTQSRLTLFKADHTLGVVRRRDHTFYDTLRNKLMWGRDGRYL